MKRPPPPTDAGLWLRVGAKLVDHGLWAFVETLCIGLGALANALGCPAWTMGAAYVLSSLLWYVYVFALTLRHGQTVGKMLAGIRVTGADGQVPRARVMARRIACELAFDLPPLILTAIAWAQVTGPGPEAVRRIAVFAGLGSLLSLLNPLAILLTQRKRALHDLFAGTFVVRVGEQRVGRLAALTALSLALPFGLTFGLTRPFFVEAYWVPSGSMEPTVQIGDRLLANKLTPRLRAPRHGEVVMFKAPEWVSTTEPVFVKRVVGLPGDRLQVKEGKLWRNGQPVQEPYIKEPPSYNWPMEGGLLGEIKVPSDSLVVMGDNRNNSRDSHLWTRPSPDGGEDEPAPFLPVEAVRGVWVFRFWPPGRLGTVEQGSSR